MVVVLLFGCSNADTADTDMRLVDFSCGTATCTAGEQYCFDANGGDGSDTDPAACQDLPGACAATPTCACLEAEGATDGGDCQDDGAGGLRVTVNYP